jgi:hypothetical protein
VHRSLGDFILDIVQNAIEAGSRLTRLEVIEADGRFTVVVSDTGKGMNEEELRKARDPFWTDGAKHPGRTVGLGIPFLAQAAEQAGGEFELVSRKGEGSTVRFSFDLGNIDTPPAGDLTACFCQSLAAAGDHELTIARRLDGRAWTVSRCELLEALGDLDTSASLALLDRFVRSQEEALYDLNTHMEDMHGQDDP